MIFCPDDLLIEMIIMREGDIPHPERYIITETIMDRIISSFAIAGFSFDKQPLSMTMISFFEKFSDKIKVKKKTLRYIIDLGILSLTEVPTWAMCEILADDRLKELTLFNYMLPNIKGRHIPMSLFQVIDRATIKSCMTMGPLPGVDNMRDVIMGCNDEALRFFGWCNGYSEFDPSSSVDTHRDYVRAYIGQMLLHHSEVPEEFIRWIGKHPYHINDKLGKLENLIPDLIDSNGNNLKLVGVVLDMVANNETCINLDWVNKFLIDRAIRAAVPIKDFSIFANFRRSSNVLWDMIPRLYKVCDLKTFPVEYLDGIMTMDNFTTVLRRTDGVEQIKQLILANQKVVNWIHYVFNGIPAGYYATILQAYLEVFKDPSWVQRENVYAHHKMLSTIGLIFQSQPDTWVTKYPDILRYYQVDYVTVIGAIRADAPNKKAIYEAVPLSQLSQSDILMMISSEQTCLHLNRTRSRIPFVNTADKNRSLESFFPDRSTFQEIIFRRKQYGYLMDIESEELQQKLIDLVVDEFPQFEYTFKQSIQKRLTNTFKYILSMGKKYKERGNRR